MEWRNQVVSWCENKNDLWLLRIFETAKVILKLNQWNHTVKSYFFQVSAQAPKPHACTRYGDRTSKCKTLQKLQTLPIIYSHEYKGEAKSKPLIFYEAAVCEGTLEPM